MQLSKRTSSALSTLVNHVRSKRTFSGLSYIISGYVAPEHTKAPAAIEKAPPKDVSFKEISFTFALIALSAHVACSGGSLTREKYVAFRDAFPLSGGICGKIRALFTLACRNHTPFEHYVTQIKYAFPRQQELFASLVDRLFRIANADGTIARETERILAKISHMLELSASQYTDIRARHMEPPKPRDVLGVTKKTSAERVKKRYYELMRRYHPDHFPRMEMSPEIETLLRLKISEINSAYRQLSKKAA